MAYTDQVTMIRQTLALVIILFSIPVIGRAESTTPMPVTLTPGSQVARELKSGELHAYLVDVPAGGAARVLVMQNEIDVVVSVYRPDGPKIKYVDSPDGPKGPELLQFVAERQGAYRVEITTFDTAAASGGYTITLTEVLSPDRYRELPDVEQKTFMYVPPPPTVFDQQRMGQNALVVQLRQSGVKYQGRRAFVYADQGLLTPHELDVYGRLVNRGIADAERYLGIRFDAKHYGDTRLYFFVSNDVRHSYFSGWESGQPFVFTEGRRVKTKTDPYLHETAHAILGSTGSAWLAEGIANYVSSHVSKRFGGYDHKVFDNRGNIGVDEHVKELFENPANARLLPQILSDSEAFDFSAFISDDQIQQFRDVAYPVSHSFVKFLLENTSLEKVKNIYSRKDTAKAIEEITGKTKAQWIEMWLDQVIARRQ